MRAAKEGRRDPLSYMLDVMNDPGAPKERRDRMAIAAAPFVHRRAADDKPGKKAMAQADAEAAVELNPDFNPGVDGSFVGPLN